MMLVVYGPTVTGKTNLAIKLAKKYNGELISADSRQVYKWLDIGTGKVSSDAKFKKQQDHWLVDGVKIYGFDVRNPGEQFTAADFIRYAKKTIFEIEKNSKLPIIVGGTAFYIKTLLNGLESIGIPANEETRKFLAKQSAPSLFKRLSDLDTERAHNLNESDKLNPRRLVRAIEIALYKKDFKEKSSSDQKTEIKKPYLLIGLTAPNAFLYKKADKWLDERIKSGLYTEIHTLLKAGVSEPWLKALGLEYKWSTEFILGNVSKEIANKRLKGEIHSLIRRQKTWFKKFPDIEIHDVSKKNWLDQVTNKVEQALQKM